MLKKQNVTLTEASHIFILFNLAIPQPVYNLLEQYNQFFTAHNSQLIDILILVFCFSFLFPLCIIFVESIICRTNKKHYHIAHLFIVTSLIIIYLLPIIKIYAGFLYNAYILIGQAIVIGIILSYLLHNKSFLRRFLTFMTPVIILLCGNFLWQLISAGVIFDKNTQAPAFNTKTKNVNVLLLICDEFPVTSLMDKTMEIDKERYPNIANLAEHSYWFRNATTVSDDTLKGAVPAILTGRYPDHINNQTNSIFTALSESHDFNVYETYSRFCPQHLSAIQENLGQRLKLLFSDLSVIYLHILLPSEFAKSLPKITHDWKNFIKPETTEITERNGLERLWEERTLTFHKFMNNIKKTDTPQFSFLHVLLPHIPWSYVPSGQRYGLKVEGLFGVPGVNKGEIWENNLWNTQQAYQRHLLQVGYVDTLIGKMISKLKHEGVYDQTLIIITADHGVAFIPGDSRRKLTPENKYEIMPVPLIIKIPHQKKKAIIDKNIETIDIFPTVLDVLELDIPWKINGHSAIDFHRPERPEKVCFKQNRMEKTSKLQYEKNFLGHLQSIVNKKVELFGSGNSELLYNFDRHSDLIGHSVNKAFIKNDTPPMSIEINNQIRSQIESNTKTPLSPIPVSGNIYATSPQNFNTLNLALVSNDTVISVTKAYKNNAYEGAFLFFAAPSFQSKINDLNVFIISEKDNRIHFIKVPLREGL